MSGFRKPGKDLPMSCDPVIRVSDVSKHYLIYERPEDRLKQMILPKLARVTKRGGRQYYRDFPAVSHVSFEVGRGETLGIVGRNGSGKSTLLQMICGTLTPTGGSIEVRGRIAALLELGSGFNPEFTGRENVFLNAAILGLSNEETRDRFDAIAAFADIGHFMDQPVKSYSSGMYVRLAFAVAINVDPDILIVDEALAVGDEAFQRKCYARIEAIRASGATILFVSHGAQTVVQLCDRAIMIDRGEKLMEGRPKTVINHYQRMMSLTGEEAEDAREAIKFANGWGEDISSEAPHSDLITTRPAAATDSKTKAWFDPALISAAKMEYPRKGATVSDIKIIDVENNQVNNLILNHKYYFEYTVKFDISMSNVNFSMFVKSINGVEIAGQHAFPYDSHINVEAGESVTVTLPFDCPFLPGTYSCNCGVFTRAGHDIDIRHRILDAVLFRVLPVDAHYSRLGMIDLCPDNRAVRIERKAGQTLP
ncbi:MAG: ABC transporter ATP-binding protein [Oceanicaulis sp.]